MKWISIERLEKTVRAVGMYWVNLVLVMQWVGYRVISVESRY